MIEPTIVVIAYNRVKPLQRLLKSLANANYPSENITLHVSIDGSENSKVKEVADNFEWKFGEKIIDQKSENLGLLKHVLACGKLTEKYDSIIVLEDDLVVAPGFYQYAQKANDFYSTEEKIAGVSLFTYPVEENNFYPFQAIQDDSDVHFIQVASSWGQSWSVHQWSKFVEWLTENPNGKESLLPQYILNWGANSWKKLFINYLIDTDRYFVFPTTSYSTNFEEEGTHASNTGLFQIELNYSDSIAKFHSISESKSIHDVYFELTPECLKKWNPSLEEFDFEVDIFGEKPIESVKSEYILTSRRGINSLMSFGSRMKPLVQNVLSEIEGDEINVYRVQDLLPSEKKRFLTLDSASTRLDQYTEVRKQTLEQVTVVVPVLDYCIQDLELTLSAMKSDRFYNVTLLIACSPSIENAIVGLSNSASMAIEIIPVSTENVDEMLRSGFSHCSTEYCTWIQPGMTINLERLEDVARIFQGMSQVQVLQGLEKEATQKNYLKLNTSSGRWTPQRASSNKNLAGKIRTELIFWRTSLLSPSDISKLTNANLFLELLKLNPIYLVALKLGDRNTVSALSFLREQDVKRSLDAPKFKAKGGLRSIARPVFHYWFRRNVAFFRLFYRETEQLPLVIRYDFINNSFYLDNY